MIFEILTKEKEYIKKYEIGNFDDIFEEGKINFYYNLIKYFIKKYLYIYQIQFLSEAKTVILGLIKSDLDKLFSSIEKSENKDKIKYILQHFIGNSSYKYYYEKFESIIEKRQRNNDKSDSPSTGPSSGKFNCPKKAVMEKLLGIILKNLMKINCYIRY